jgi:hypothetical protein
MYISTVGGQKQESSFQIFGWPIMRLRPRERILLANAQAGAKKRFEHSASFLAVRAAKENV